MSGINTVARSQDPYNQNIERQNSPSPRPAKAYSPPSDDGIRRTRSGGIVVDMSKFGIPEQLPTVHQKPLEFERYYPWAERKAAQNASRSATSAPSYAQAAGSNSPSSLSEAHESDSSLSFDERPTAPPPSAESDSELEWRDLSRQIALSTDPSESDRAEADSSSPESEPGATFNPFLEKKWKKNSDTWNVDSESSGYEPSSESDAPASSTPETPRRQVRTRRPTSTPATTPRVQSAARAVFQVVQPVWIPAKAPPEPMVRRYFPVLHPVLMSPSRIPSIQHPIRAFPAPEGYFETISYVTLLSGHHATVYRATPTRPTPYGYTRYPECYRLVMQDGRIVIREIIRETLQPIPPASLPPVVNASGDEVERTVSNQTVVATEQED